MPLSPENTIAAVKFVGKRLAEITSVPGAGWAIAVVDLIYKHGDKIIHEKYQRTLAKEGCPHIALIDGNNIAYMNMLDYLGIHGGLGWQSSDGNPFWYYHSQADFQPIDFVEGYSCDEHHEISHRQTSTKKLTCRQCIQISKQRSG
jgi:hypothetical protein